MRFLYLELENYIGIYNGMQLNSIKIDMTHCMYRTLIIRGENGSGKSTIFKALSVFPDGNDSFIPGMPAKKIISILDHDVIYTITFIHGIKSNGDRDTTKAFIRKNIAGQEVELNENGNVTSFKDIIFSELSLDPNFVALSQLSSDDKGLATKRPAERKKFVNNIIDSLEVYNGIYKAITKKSSSVKSLIDNLVSKLGSLGDINSMRARLNELDGLIKEVTDRKSGKEQEIMDAKAAIKVLDPDNAIQNEYNTILADLNSISVSYRACLDKIGKPMFCAPDELAIADEQLANYKNSLDTSRNNRASIEQSIVSTTERLSEILSQLNDKKTKLESLNRSSIIDIEASHEKYVEIVAQLKKAIDESGIDPDLFTKDEYITALETIRDIKHIVDLFRSDFTETVIDEAVKIYRGLGWPSIAPLQDTTPENKIIDSFTSSRDETIRTLNSLAMDMEAIKKLGDRPATCTDDSCRFIADLVAKSKSDPEKRYNLIKQQYDQDTIDYENAKKSLEFKTTLNDALNQIRLILRSMDINKGILSRLPNGGIFTSKEEFFDRLLAGDDFYYIDKLYSYIDLANTVEMYHKSKEILADLKVKLDQHRYKLEVLRDYEADIKSLEELQTKYTATLSELRISLRSTDEEIANYTNCITSLSIHRDNLLAVMNTGSRLVECQKRLDTISTSMIDIDRHNDTIRRANNEIKYYDGLIRDYNETRSSVEFSIRQYEQYEQELSVLQEQYNRIEIIKHYSSPTKGIQLVFMELYMGKILTIANELLSFLFDGAFAIQPFIINEDEFRIPCLGNGYINDDISSMSASQLTMISMIISFALLHTSSTKYNIIKLDEIDGPLDENNRIQFISVINRIMDLMNVEQCIMVSHSAELQVDTSDVILLKSSQLSTDYDRGNIIWRY